MSVHHKPSSAESLDASQTHAAIINLFFISTKRLAFSLNRLNFRTRSSYDQTTQSLLLAFAENNLLEVIILSLCVLLRD